MRIKQQQIKITHFSRKLNILIARLYFVYWTLHFSVVLNHHFLKRPASMQKNTWNVVASHIVCSELNAVLYCSVFYITCTDMLRAGTFVQGLAVPAEIKPF